MTQSRGHSPCTASVLTGASKSFIKCNYGSNITHTSGNEGGMGTPCTDTYFVEQKADSSRYASSGCAKSMQCVAGYAFGWWSNTDFWSFGSESSYCLCSPPCVRVPRCP